MLKIKDEIKTQIFGILEDYLNYACFNIPNFEDNLIAFFLCGEVNKGLFMDGDEIQAIAIIKPTEEDLYFKIPIDEVVGNEYKIHLLDFRLYIQLLKDQKFYALETLYTDYAYIAPEYTDIFFEYFIKERENIVKLNRQELLNNVFSQIQSTYHLCYNPTEKDKRKFLYRYIRYILFLEKYTTCAEYRDCLTPASEEEYELLYKLKIDYKDISNDQMIRYYKDGIEKAEQIMNKWRGLDSPRRERALERIKTGAIMIMKKSSKNYDDFIQLLTPNEKTAFLNLLKIKKDEMYVSVTVLCSETGISRPIYTNLFNKMKIHNIAEISNGGVKGSKIVWLN